MTIEIVINIFTLISMDATYSEIFLFVIVAPIEIIENKLKLTTSGETTHDNFLFIISVLTEIIVSIFT